MSNYNAIIVKIKEIKPHPNADRLMITTIFGEDVIVGKDVKKDDLGIWFPLESQIGLEFAVENDFIRRKDENGNSCGGMFENNRRVRAQKLRGVLSMGFYTDISSLIKVLENHKIEIPEFKEGDEIGIIGDLTISSKYVSNQQKSSKVYEKKTKKEKQSRMILDQFRFHYETSHLDRNISKIDPESHISITWKMHGTSSIAANIQVLRNLKWWEKALLKIGIKIETKEYDVIYSSRRVIKNGKNLNHFYDSDIWTHAGKHFKDLLHKGESVYFEIVGYLPSGSYIQKNHDYGCSVGKYHIYIYRITMTNQDGVVHELTWDQVKKRCEDFGIAHVPEIFSGKAKHFLNGVVDNFHNDLLDKIKKFYVHDQDSIFCKNKVPEEGIVLRVENFDSCTAYKLKSKRHYLLETSLLDSGEVDIEEINNVDIE